MWRRLVLITCFLNVSFLVYSQDTLKNKNVTLHSPRKAVLLSLIPGGGQIYNNKYWKVPVIYVAFAGLGYLFTVNNTNYHTYYSLEKNYPGAQTDELFMEYQTNKNDYLHARDLDLISMMILYGLNLIDAAVDAHLSTFDVGKDLSMKLFPVNFYTSENNHPATGLGLVVKF